jgi:membrane-bound metal-dependent hydrolase YbcI (DUF457 family)
MPLGRVHISLPVANLLRLELIVTGFCYLLPDLVDKSLLALGVGNGRYVAHTLLFVFLVAFALSLKKRVYGLLALCAGILHLLLDLPGRGFVPWFYPFVRYDFPHLEIHNFWLAVCVTLIQLVSILLVAFLILRLVSWFKKRNRPESS